MPPPTRRPADALALAALVLVVVAPFLGQLGFYSDDWDWLGELSAHTSFGDRFASIWQPNVRMRPVQLLLFTATYHVAGPAPLAFHVVTAALLVMGALFLHAALRELGVPRALAVALPLVYALMPQYSSIRFWIAASAAMWSMTMCSLVVLADLRAVRAWRDPRRRVAWLALAAVARAAGVLAYEIFLPFLCLSPLLAWLHARRLARHVGPAGEDGAGPVPSWLTRPAGLLALGALAALPLAPVVAYKMAVSTRMRFLGLGDQLTWWRWIVGKSAMISLRDWGLAFPRTLWRLARDHGTAPAAAVAAVAGMASAWWVARAGRDAPPARDARGPAMIGLGVLLFPVGYAIFLRAQQADFATTGIGNRTSIAASLGVALAWVGLAHVASAWLVPRRVRARAFGLLVGTMVAASAYVHGVLAEQWAAAWHREQAVVQAVRRAFPDPPRGTTLLLGGVCPYVGPAVVFEAPWDLRGALWTAYAAQGRHDLKADVVTPNLRVEDTAIVTALYYGSLVQRYPYGAIVLFDPVRGTREPLPDAAAARRALAAYGPDLRGGCPPGGEGQGVALF